MNTRRTLIISSLFASLATLAAAPAMAQTHLEAAQELVDNIRPEDNAWGSPCSIGWTDYTATTNGACLFTLSLQHADSNITPAVVDDWWGSTNPGSASFYNHIANGNHFDEIIDVGEILAGDIIAVTWNTTSGHLMIVEDEPYEVATPFAPIFAGTTQWLTGIIDSTTSPHGTLDSRYHAEASGLNDEGVGRGVMRIYTSDDTGEIVGYTWSDVTNGSYYDQATRALIVGRFYN